VWSLLNKILFLYYNFLTVLFLEPLEIWNFYSPKPVAIWFCLFSSHLMFVSTFSKLLKRALMLEPGGVDVIKTRSFFDKSKNDLFF
jgi:hypothetical protein